MSELAIELEYKESRARFESDIQTSLNNALVNGYLTKDKYSEALSKAKALVMAVHQGTGIATSEQVAEYFEVSVEAIELVVRRLAKYNLLHLIKT